MDNLVEEFVKQGEATKELAAACKFHPMFHSFIETNKLREQVLAQVGASNQLYDNGPAVKFQIDSTFDEIIDALVESLSRCPCKEK